MFQKFTLSALLIAAAWQFSPIQVSRTNAQTAAAQPPRADTLRRDWSRGAEYAAIVPDPKVVALATATRALTDQGLFAEEFDAILEAAQSDPQLFAKVLERITEPAK
jgi:hypothetical protein